jgi:hypothetical protein
MKVHGGQRNHIKKKHKRQLKQQRWDAGQPINNGPPMTLGNMRAHGHIAPGARRTGSKSRTRTRWLRSG